MSLRGAQRHGKQEKRDTEKGDIQEKGQKKQKKGTGYFFRKKK
jgi:hypothetical protein